MLKYTRGVAGVTGKAREREVVSNTWAHLPNLWPEDICYGGGGTSQQISKPMSPAGKFWSRTKSLPQGSRWALVQGRV